MCGAGEAFHDGNGATSGTGGAHPKRCRFSLRPLSSGRSRTEASPASRRRRCNEERFRRHAGRKPCGGWDSSFTSLISRCFRRSFARNGRPKRCQLALLAIALTASKALVAMATYWRRAASSDSRWWRLWRRRLTYQPREKASSMVVLKTEGEPRVMSGVVVGETMLLAASVGHAERHFRSPRR